MNNEFLMSDLFGDNVKYWKLKYMYLERLKEEKNSSNPN